MSGEQKVTAAHRQRLAVVYLLTELLKVFPQFIGHSRVEAGPVSP